MAPDCLECGGVTTWDDSVGSTVCTSCGTLVDPSQSVLTSQYDFPEPGAYYGSSWDITSYKRTRFSNWTLADQDKEARDKRNSVAILGFIESLARSLNATSLSPRAMNLFRQAKQVMQFRWGRKAKLIAGVCLAVALREKNRSDCLHDISFLVEEPFLVLSRSFISVIGALQLSLSRAEASSYIPILHQHLSSSLVDSSIPWTRQLSSISLHMVSNTATSLSSILSRIGSQSVIESSPPSIACALFALSIESELRIAVKHLASLIQVMSTRLDVGKGAVMASYKAIQDVLASLITNVPWLDKYDSENGRSRVAKRTIVARATKDIVAFYNDSWKESKKPTFNITPETDTRPQDQDTLTDDEYKVPRKKRKTQHKVAMQFLLDPAMYPLPNSTYSSPLGTTSLAPPQSMHSLLTYYLSTNITSQKPTRLQLLTAERGGADHISDNELFEEGEMESLMREEEEMKVTAHLYDWDSNEEVVSNSDPLAISAPRVSNEFQRTNRESSDVEHRRSRINLEALSRFLNNEEAQVDDQPFSGLLGPGHKYPFSVLSDSSEAEDEGETNPPPPHEHRPSLTPKSLTDDEIIVEDWRPASPGRGAATSDDWYEVYE